MDIKQLKYFLEVCKSGSFSKAAGGLYITEQGLSKAIKSLEEELNIQLFYRDGNEISLTNYAECLKDKSEHIVHEFELLKCSLEKIHNQNGNKLRIGYSPGIAAILMWDSLLSFMRDNQDIKIEPIEYNGYLCDEAVYNEKVNLAVTVAPVDMRKLDFRLIVSKKICLIVNKKNSLSKIDMVDSIDSINIADEKIIIPDESYKIFNKISELCKNLDFNNCNVYTTGDMKLLTYMLQKNKAISIAIKLSNIPQLKYIPFSHTSANLEVGLITKKGQHLSETEKQFINYLLSYYSGK